MIKVVKENGNFLVTNTETNITVAYPWISFTLDEHIYKYPHEIENVFRTFFYPANPLNGVTVEFSDEAKALVKKICELNYFRD